MVTFRKTVEWDSKSGLFSFSFTAGKGELRTPDGQITSLSFADWLNLKDAIHALLPTAKSSVASNAPPNAGQPWTNELDGLLMLRWSNECASASAIASEFGRTTGSIAARLVRLGLAANKDEAIKRL